MPDILHDFPILRPIEEVFDALSSPEGLSAWWTLTAAGIPGPGEVFELDFGPGYLWQAEMSVFEPPNRLEWTIIDADPDWINTRIGFELNRTESGTKVQFYHAGWPSLNDHYRTSCFCWAMYLRLFRRHMEFGEFVPYAERLDV